MKIEMSLEYNDQLITLKSESGGYLMTVNNYHKRKFTRLTSVFKYLLDKLLDENVES